MNGPVFVLSSPRTGSTLLRYVLDTHRAVCSPGELRLGRLCESLFLTLQRTLGQVENHPVATRDDVLVRRVREVVDGIMDEYRGLRNAHIWCDKAPENLDHLKALELVYPEARYVCLHRDALDVAHSCLEVSRQGFMTELSMYAAADFRNLVAAMLESWIEKTRTLLDFEREHPHRCFRIRYESLVREPAETLRPLFDFLNLDWEDDLLDRVFTESHDAGGGDPKIVFTKKIRSSHLGRGSRRLLSRVPDRVRTRLAPLLEELGYPPLEESRDRAFAARSDEDDGDSSETEEELSTETVFTRIVPDTLASKETELRDTDSLFRFVISDGEPSAWDVDLTRWPPVVTDGDDDADADLTVATTEAVLLRIVKGELHPFTAYREGLVEIRGAPELSYKLGLFF